MNLCLLLGSILLIATVVSFPLYQSAAYDRMVQDEFRSYYSSEGQWPGLNSMIFVSQKDNGGVAITRMENFNDTIFDDLGVTKKDTICSYQLSQFEAVSTMQREDMSAKAVNLATISDLENHVKLLAGEMYSEKGVDDDGALQVVISQSAMIKLQVLVGETIKLKGSKGIDGKEIRLRITGIVAEEDPADFYWQEGLDAKNNVCLMNFDTFKEHFTGENARRYTITCKYFSLFEYDDILADQVDHLAEATRYMANEGSFKATMKEPAYLDILDSFLTKRGRIEATLQILQIPVLIMLGAFLFMISGQMYDMERNEISVIKSRGSSGGQIFRLYLYQMIFISLLGGALGIPLGAVFSRILGSARNFLEFDAAKSLPVKFNTQTAEYALVAILVVLAIMTLPAIKHSRVTIVNLKQQKALKKKSLWEKLFLDVILLAVSLYGYYTFSKSGDELGKSVMMGKSLDPLLYISSSLFIVGMGLLFLRLQPLIIQFIYFIGKRFWRPASYASFMENLKNGRKQQFIMLFLIMTISLGMYHATVARTILRNAQDNTEYVNGADIVMKEVWIEIKDLNGKPTGQYVEPEYDKYITADFADSYARVFLEDGVKCENISATVMGIHTKEFGRTATIDRSLTEKHFFEYLNELAVVPDGVIVSRNFETKLGKKVGDTIAYTSKYSAAGTATGKIVDFVDYWPGYAPSETVLDPDGSAATYENYMIVTHYDALRNDWGVLPYEVWLKLKEGHTSQEVYNWIEANDVHVAKYVDRAKEIRMTSEDPLLQGTNGVLTMGFIVTMILCGVGYLIYWIMSIRSREMIFGVLRACGMHKMEMLQMLMNEQIFCGVFSVAAGIGIGQLTSRMFVPILQQAYAASKQVLPMKLIINASDMMRLYVVIAGSMILCLAILILLIFKLNVTKALKLGEE